MLAAGADCRLEVWENMWHDFQMYPSKTASTPSRIWPISCWKCSDGAAPAQYRQNTPHKQAGFLYMFFRLKAAKSLG